ncbi:MAG: hypothetical protein WCK58_03050 [Chloroflexota bacterium]
MQRPRPRPALQLLLAVTLTVTACGGGAASGQAGGSTPASDATAPATGIALVTSPAVTPEPAATADPAVIPDPASNPAPPPVAQPSGSVEAASGTPANPAYTIEQAISDRAQLNTIAFDALGFLTGNTGSDSFFPPGKVADFWGFQYLRDNDPSAMGHNTDFLTRASNNMLNVLTAAQRASLVTLAKAQVANVNSYATKRFVLMSGFRRLLSGKLPAGTTALSATAVQAYSATLYKLDGQMTLARAKVMGPMLATLTTAQKATLDAMVGKGMTSWSAAAEPSDLRGLAREVKEAVMTYAGDMFSWYAGSVTADTYFCPERHGTYFGSFYLKDAPAVGNPGYSIDTTLTGNLGAALLAALTPAQAARITALVDGQRTALASIVATRQAVAQKLRVAMTGGTIDSAAVTTLMDTYGKLDGQMVASYAKAFAEVGKSLTTAQKAALVAMRDKLLGSLTLPSGAYLYSTPIAMPVIPSTNFLFN